ncbi:MAG: hypothetical protein V3S33_01645 [Gammaproteobacteria bacterium]
MINYFALISRAYSVAPQGHFLRGKNLANSQLLAAMFALLSRELNTIYFDQAYSEVP